MERYFSKWKNFNTAGLFAKGCSKKEVWAQIKMAKANFNKR